MKLILSRIANKKGQLAALLNFFLAALVIVLVAVFCFELSRYFLAHDELKTNTEAAALCCETALVSSGDPTDATNQQSAVATALTLFQQNTILGQSMVGASVPGGSSGSPGGSPSDLSPAPGQAQICFQFLDPVSRTPVTAGASGTLIQATGSYCYTPAFGHFLGMGNAQFTFQVSAYSGVPRIDVVLAFDISGGGDYYTPITILHRYAGGNTSTTGGSTGGGSPTGGTTTTGGTLPCLPSRGINYLAPVGVNGQPFLGGTVADLTGHIGGKTALYPQITFPQQLENLANFAGPQFSEQGPTQYLAGYDGNTAGTPAWMNAAPGDYCPCQTTTGGGQSTSGGGGGRSGGISYGNDDSNHYNYLNTGKFSNLPQPILTASNKPIANEDLQHLCAEIDAFSGGKKIKNKFDSNQLDKKLSTISFAPLFVAYPQAGLNSGTNTTSNSTTATATSGGNPINTQPYQYNSFYYMASSHVPPNAAYSDSSAIPGRCPGGTGPSSVGSGPPYPNIITDLVGNIDGNPQFTGSYIDSSSFTFYDAGTLVEAARYNLENTSVAGGALVDYSLMGVTPTVGYASAYYTDILNILQPLDDMLYAASSLIQEMSNVADAHFCFIAFNDTAGNVDTGVNPPQYSNTEAAGYIPMISSWFPYAAPIPGGTGSAVFVEPSLPFVALDPNNNNDNLMSQLPVIYPNGNRNVSAVLHAAINQLQTNGRPGANKAIILFCDGQPTEANTANTQALADAVSAVQSANTQIPIYCVCVADPATTPISNNGVSADDSANDNAYGSSICAQSAPVIGSGLKYYRVDWSNANSTQSSLCTVVDNIVRQMVCIPH